jgi:hypothetical protein
LKNLSKILLIRFFFFYYLLRYNIYDNHKTFIFRLFQSVLTAKQEMNLLILHPMRIGIYVQFFCVIIIKIFSYLILFILLYHLLFYFNGRFTNQGVPIFPPLPPILKPQVVFYCEALKEVCFYICFSNISLYTFI